MLLDRQEKFELGRKLFLGVQTVREVDTADAAISVDLDAQGFDVVGSVSATSKVRQIELDLVPSIVQSHGHGTDERLYSRSTLWLDWHYLVV